MGCWIKSRTTDPEQQFRALLFRSVFMLVPYLIGFLGTAISMVILYRNVLQTEESAGPWIVLRRSRSRISSQVKERGILYVGILWVCFTPSLLLTIPASFPDFFNWKFQGFLYNTLLVINSALLPSHGTLNLLVYTRMKWGPWMRQSIQTALKPFLGHGSSLSEENDETSELS